MELKYNYDYVKELCKNIGLDLLEDEYIDCKTKMKVKMINGCILEKTLDGILNKDNIRLKNNDYYPVSKNNPYSIDNIKIYMINHDINLSIESEKYEGSKCKLDFIDSEGYKYSNSWDDLKDLVDRRKTNPDASFSKFGRSNKKYTIENINNFIKINKIDLILLSKKFHSSKSPLDFIDSEGYKYGISLDLLQQPGKPERYHICNPYTIYNIGKYADTRGYTLLSLIYSGSEYELIFKCKKEGHPPFKKSWVSFYSNKTGCNICSIENRSGENSPHYNHNLTSEERNKRRDTPEYKNWRANVLKRDKYTCKCCGKKSCKSLIAHHLDGYDLCIERRYDVDNGVTLCDECHKLFHHFYGYGSNTKYEFEVFISMYGKINTDDEIQENDLYKDSIESRKLKLDKLRNSVKSSHSKFVDEVDGYEYINSYFENDIIITPKNNLKNSNYKVKSRNDIIKKYNIKKVKSSTVYIKVKHLFCGSIYDVQASQFKTQNKRCGKCCGTYEKSFEYYIANKYGDDISNYYFPEDNNGVKASTIYAKGSSKEYTFRCGKNSKHKKYKCTTEAFIRSYDYSRGCKKCQKENFTHQMTKLHENNIQYSEDYIKELIEKSLKNSQLEIIGKIYSDGKSRYVPLGCKKHKHTIIPKMSVTIFNNDINKKIFCNECKLEAIREKIYKELISNGFEPYDGEIEKWENIKSRIRCREKDGYIVNTTVEYLRKSKYESRNIIFNQPIIYKDDLTYNITLLCKKVGLKFNGEYDNSLTTYTAIKYDKYKVSFRISDIRDIIENNKDYEKEIKNKFNEFHKNNIYKMENLSIFLQENGINLISKDIDYIDGIRFVDISFYKDINIEDKMRKIEFKATLNLNDYLCKKNLPSISHYSNKKFLKENMQKIIDAKGIDYDLLDIIEERDSEEKLRIKFSAYKGKIERIYKVTIDRDSIIDKRIREPKPFHISNIFVNENIDKFCAIYKPQYKRISNYENAKKIMEWEDTYNKKIVPMSWSNFSRKK